MARLACTLALLCLLAMQAVTAQEPPAATASAASAAAPASEAASEPAPPPPPSCSQLSARAAAADLRATTAQSQGRDLAELAQLVDEAVKQWTLASVGCEGHARERAQRNLADNEKTRAALAERLASGSQCEVSHRDAASVQDMAVKAFGERRWPDAAMLYRKAETLWDLAAENCSGLQQQVAVKRREQSEIDGHNAEYCAPLFDKARDYTQKFRSATAGGLALPERQQQSQIAETLWRDAVRQCRGTALELAGNNAAALARERGTPWVATQLPGAVAAAPAAAAASNPVPVAAAKPATKPVAAPVPVPAPAPSPAVVAKPAAVATVAVAAEAKEVDLRAGDTRYKGLFTREEGQVLSGSGRVEWANGDVYEGPLVRNERHGQGTLTWANGQRYSGEWVHDKATGQGKLHFANGNDYEGSVVDGVPQGEGQLRYASGDIYKGPLTQGLANGRGVYTWANGQRYEGEWVNDKPNGQGRLRFVNGNLYEGTVVDGIPKGRGRMVFASGDVYEGTFANGLADGEGNYQWKSGDRYKGGWAAGRKQGRGLFVWASGDQWEGEFKNDERTEDGVLTRKDDIPPPAAEAK
ncbi:hypothetical protein SNE35_08550 [Paucibacter sp. R3-3]|uniref:MORN repeat-containing protein n=1 Tax=Roseateles agri TaxID=3098619 RepID=A0ABU5DE47_9BURK|nr:hypothetical protein [Paucibacter sp. R3-3]MDY0744553.1 hypothetical protein [Paucibacter sp. R3-3]